jgi:hypothetical protein
MTSGKYKATAALSVLYGFETWLLLQGKEIDYKLYPLLLTFLNRWTGTP